MASGASRQVKGSYLGTGSALNIDKVGFKPSAVLMFNEDDLSFSMYIEGMPDGYAAHQKGGTTSYISTGGITLRPNGFQVGTNADLNTDGERVWWMAWE